MLKSWIKNNWHDAVWSKVISWVITLTIAFMATTLYSLIEKIPSSLIIESLKSTQYQISLLYIVMGAIIISIIVVPMILTYYINKIGGAQIKVITLSNLNQFLTKGDWFCEWTINGKIQRYREGSGKEKCFIRNNMEYYRQDGLSFILSDINIDVENNKLFGQKSDLIRFIILQKLLRL